QDGIGVVAWSAAQTDRLVLRHIAAATDQRRAAAQGIAAGRRAGAVELHADEITAESDRQLGNAARVVPGAVALARGESTTRRVEGAEEPAARRDPMRRLAGNESEIEAQRVIAARLSARGIEAARESEARGTVGELNQRVALAVGNHNRQKQHGGARIGGDL